MKKINFLIHINSLKSGEVRKFGIYLKSTFPKSNMLLKTYDYYVKYHRKKKPPPDFKVAYKEIFEMTTNSDKEILNLQNYLSDLFLKLKDYLIQQRVLASEFEKEFLWLQILAERELEHQNNLQLERLKKSGGGIQNIWTSIEQLKIYHYEFFRNDFQKHNPHIDNLQRGMEYLEEFYRSIKLKFAAEIINRKSLLPEQNHDLDISLFIPDFEKISLEQLSKNSELYLSLIQFLKNKNPEEYRQLEKFLKLNHSKLHQDETLTTIIYMINYLAEEIKSGNSTSMSKAFDLYLLGLEHKILIRNGKMDALPFNNIVNIACYLKKYDWAKTFVEDYKKYIKDGIREEVSSVSSMMILFKEKEYVEISPIYIKIKFTNVISKITGTLYYLMSLYEIGEHEMLFVSLDSFRSFLNKNKMVGKNNKEAALNFTKILKHFIRRKFSQNQLEHEININESVFFRTWLKEKVETYQQHIAYLP